MCIALIVSLVLPVSLQAVDAVIKPYALDPLPSGARACLGFPRFISEGRPWAVAFSPDGKWLAVGTDSEFGREAAAIQVRELATGKLTYTLDGHIGAVKRIQFSADGKRLVSSAFGDTVRVWDFEKQEEERTFGVKQLEAFELTPDGKRLITVDRAGTVQVWGMATGEELRHFGGKAKQGVNWISLGSEGNVLAVTEDNNLVRLWDVGTGKQVGAFADDVLRVRAAYCSPVGTSLAVVESTLRVRLVDPGTGDPLWKLETSGRQIVMMAFSPNGKLFLTVESDKYNVDWAFVNAMAELKLWDAKTGNLIRAWPAHDMAPTSVAFSSDSKTVVTASLDHSVRLWDASTGKEDPRFSGHAYSVTALAFSPDGKTHYSASHDGTVRVWDAATGMERAVIPGHTGWVKALSVTADGKVLASGGNDGTIRLWDVATRTQRKLLRDGARVQSLAFSPDGKTLVSGSHDAFTSPPPENLKGTVRLWDWQAGQELRRLDEPGGAHCVLFSPDGKLLAAGSHQRLYVWDFETGKVRLDGKLVHTDWARVGGFLADGTIATVGRVEASALHPPPAVRLWNLNGKLQHAIPFENQNGSFYAIAVSRDGKSFAAAHGSTISVRDLATRREIASFAGHPYHTTVLTFSHDGRTLASGGVDGAIMLWNLPR